MGNELQAKAPEAGVTVHDVLSSRIYLPRFLEKCSSRGVTPQTSDEVGGLLTIAQNIRTMEMKTAAGGTAEPTPIEKAASASTVMVGGAEPDPAPYLQDAGVIAAFEAGGVA